ncbi:MAG: DUF6600 domain-containing protein [Chthoniobacterales bacterium]
MKKLILLPLVAALAVFVSCQKQQTEEERKAEVERQVQDRLAAERTEAEKQRLAQQQADLDAREKAMADREAVTTSTPAEETAVVEQVTEPTESTTETQSTAEYGMFYEKLDSYGDWRDTENYGYVFQPRVAEESRDWRPYTEGRWVYSDAGWTWVSDEPFGWATYHYGRWVRLRRVGWVWVPGKEWGPAWVSWRTSRDYVGWAPLPPEARFDRRQGIQNWADNYYDIGPDQYSFVASNEFGSDHVRRAVVPQERNITIAVETTNVTRITFANTRIVNEGPNYEELRSRGPRPIERLHLRWQRNADTAPARIRGDELEVSAPAITEVREMPRPRRVRERVVDLSIDNGWTAITDHSAAERARTKFRTEATPPPNGPPKRFVRPRETATTTSPAPASTVATPPAQTPATASNPTPVAAPKTIPSAAPSAPAASPTPPAKASPTSSPAGTTAASSTPAASPRTRPSASIRPRPTPSAAPSDSAVPSATPAATVPPTTPAATASVPPLNRVRPSPSVPAATAPAITPVTAASAPATTPAIPPPNRRRMPPPISPVPTVPETTSVPSIAPRVPTTPPVRRPSPLPRTTPPMPAPSPGTTEAAETPAQPNVPRRVPPIRMTPPVTSPAPAATTPAPAVTPAPNEPATTPAPNAPGPGKDRARAHRPRFPMETGTPTASPSIPPN